MAKIKGETKKEEKRKINQEEAFKKELNSNKLDFILSKYDLKDNYIVKQMSKVKKVLICIAFLILFILIIIHIENNNLLLLPKYNFSKFSFLFKVFSLKNGLFSKLNIRKNYVLNKIYNKVYLINFFNKNKYICLIIIDNIKRNYIIYYSNNKSSNIFENTDDIEKHEKESITYINLEKFNEKRFESFVINIFEKINKVIFYIVIILIIFIIKPTFGLNQKKDSRIKSNNFLKFHC